MDWQQYFVAGLVILVFILFVREWLAPELVAMGALLACAAAGILDLNPNEPNYALKVFGHPAVITVAAMFILSASLEKTGVIERLGEMFERVAGSSSKQVLIVMMFLVAVLSGFVNNTPVVVVFMPIVIKLCRKRDMMASHFLIPLSYAAIVGGTMTIIGTSTNLIAAGFAEQTEGVRAFRMFDILPLGLVFVAVTFVYLLVFGKKVLPDRTTLAALIDNESSREFITHAIVKSESTLAGKNLSETWLATEKGIRIIDVIRDGERLKCPLNEIVFEEQDEIIIKGRLDGLMGVTNSDGLALLNETDDEAGLEGVRTESAVIMEGIIGPESNLVGETLAKLNFRQRYGVIILAVHRRGKNLQEKFESVPLAFGDTLLVQGSRERMNRLFLNKDFINLSERQPQQFRYHLAAIPVLAILGFIVFNTLGWVPPSFLALGGALLVMATRCIDPKEAYEAVDWHVIFMIFGMLGLGMALEATGLAGEMAGFVVDHCGGQGPHFLLAAFYLLAALMTELISNSAVAALLTPLAIIVGQQLGLEDPRPFIVAVMFGASASFATPIGYQTNTFVYGAGGYKFSDFFRAGFPLAVLLWIVASLLIPVFFPFEFVGE